MPPRLRAAALPIFVLIFVGAAVALVLHMRVFNFVTDDAFISFVYARNLVEHGQLVFNLGERVEGYTNFLWTVFLAGWMKLGWQPESSSIAWGTACAIGTMAVCAWLMRRLALDEGSADSQGRATMAFTPWDAVPAVFLAAVPGYACWSSGGLETQMFTFFVTLGGALYVVPSARAIGRPRYGFAVAFALAALTRPEGHLFFALAMLHCSIRVLRERRLPRRGELACVAIFVALVAPHWLWRHAYYGYWLPNTFYIKSSGGAGSWGRGAYYLLRYFQAYWLPLFFVPPILAVLLQRTNSATTRRLYGLVLLSAPIFFVYVASVGGDFMGLFRFALPVVPLVFVAAASGARELSRGRDVVAAVVVAALLVVYAGWAGRTDRGALTIGADNGIDTPGFLRWYTADRAAIGKWFGQFRQPDDYAAVGGAGAQVYYSRIPSLDCFGLSDAYIAHKIPAVSNRPGHQKYAPVDYQLSKHPTIITSTYYRIGSAPFVGDDAAFWRARGYHYVSVQVPGLSSPWYTFLKRMDRRVGPLAAINGEID